MTSNPDESQAEAPVDPQRVFLHESGWRIGHKLDSTREFCYMMAPGQDYYHRLLDGEAYVYNHEERLCFACAERRGLLSRQAKGLRESLGPVPQFDAEGISEFEVRALDPER